MAIIKCKMCGGDLNLMEGQSVAECEYCGSRQTVPAADNDKKLTLFARANRLRAACEFDKAAGIYETIVADFPEEAESYWGLVLCKYGIEYVDDPATGKKIPTCHRSSFDSVMDDGNFEQAMENADEVALRVYRQEAKQIEEIRKGILEVSSSEKPYDIFICYKETDPNGDRTVDSLLAQDIYDALTSKGYRVFFSRITLEDKLGQAYEPYIFAALNSAKIMLAVGTCYEHYNAVWVKNEWSRYLKIIAQDKNKYLIPCYKNIDAYDIPKEFAHLQGQDMGKVGAIADLLRGIEKLMPRSKSNTVVVQEKVVVGGTGGSNKIASLLDRGNMALEDGDWAKADSFFEDVLNNDSKNAQAYIGKTLAQERCRTMDALVRKRKDVYQNVRSETLQIKERTAHINQMAEKYRLRGYVEGTDIRQLYVFDLSYTSEVSGRQKQYREEENWWQNHRQLSRAEKFAVGAVAEHLQSEKKHLFSQLAERVKKAQEADARAVAKLEAAYTAHIAGADKHAKGIYNDGLARRVQNYQKWLEQAKKETDPKLLNALASCFADLGDYKDSKNLAEHCRKRADEEQDKLDEAEARRRIQARMEAEAKRAKQKKMATIAAAVASVVIAIILILNLFIIPSNRYKQAETLLNEGNKGAAAIMFYRVGDFKDARERSMALWAEVADRNTIAAGKTFTAAINNDGKLGLAGEDFDSDSTPAKWSNVIAISGCDEHLIGLMTDGTVKVFDTRYYHWERTNISSWQGIVSVSTGAKYTAGLKADGTVAVISHTSEMDNNFNDALKWEDIIDISTGYDHLVGLNSDGTVVACGVNNTGACNVSEWQDIVAISAGSGYTVGLKSDGTVVVTGYEEKIPNGTTPAAAPSNNAGSGTQTQYDISAWTDIIEISAGPGHIMGLKADGTVVAVGSNTWGQCEVGGWQNITAIAAGTNHTAGLKADGFAIATGYNSDYQCNVGEWNGFINLKQPAEAAYVPKIRAILEEKQTNAYAAAEKLLAAGDPVGAFEVFKALGNFKDSRDRAVKTAYAAGEALLTQGKTAQAAMAFGAAGNTADAKTRSYNLWQNVASWNTIYAGNRYSAALTKSGSLLITNSKFTRPKDINWGNVVSVSTSYSEVHCLMNDGTAWTISDKGEATQLATNVVYMDGPYLFVHADGTVTYYMQPGAFGWKEIIQACHLDGGVVGLKADGTVVSAHISHWIKQELDLWRNIVALCAGNDHILGLKADGTVVSVGDDDYGECKVGEWRNIVAISTGNEHTAGLKSDGTVVAVGRGKEKQLNTTGWTNIVAISVGDEVTIGLKANGAMVSTKGGDVAKWTNVRLSASSQADKYDEATNLLRNGKYYDAAIIFQQLTGYKDSADKAAWAKDRMLKTAKKGDTVVFGTYSGEALEWTVMSKNGNVLTLFCNRTVSGEKYDRKGGINWVSSSMYESLHKKYVNWFSEAELALIRNTPNGKIYPPSKQELEQFYGITIQQNKSYSALKSGEIARTWWTRTPEGVSIRGELTIISISESGYVSRYSPKSSSWDIRPVIQITVP